VEARAHYKGSKNAAIHLLFIPYNMTSKKHKQKTEKALSLSNIIQYSVANSFMFPPNGNKDHMWKTIYRIRNGNCNVFLLNGTGRFLILYFQIYILGFVNVPFPKT